LKPRNPNHRVPTQTNNEPLAESSLAKKKLINGFGLPQQVIAQKSSSHLQSSEGFVSSKGVEYSDSSDFNTTVHIEIHRNPENIVYSHDSSDSTQLISKEIPKTLKTQVS